jgi:hypothetical protein
MAMLLDYIPEAIALGAVFAENANLRLLLALFIALQNFPESFNAFLEMRKGGSTAKHCLTNFSLLSVVGIGASVLGYYLLADKPIPNASLMLFSSAGIIYLIFQYIAPMSKLKRAGLPALGASLGFWLDDWSEAFALRFWKFIRNTSNISTTIVVLHSGSPVMWELCNSYILRCNIYWSLHGQLCLIITMRNRFTILLSN